MATTPWDNSPPTIVERYGVATGTSDLTGFGGMIPPGGGSSQAEMLMAAALCDNQLGVILSRLQTEWDSASKPSRPGPRLLQALTGYIKREDDEARETAKRNNKPWTQPQGSPPVRAVERAAAWYAGELRLLAVGLKSRREAWDKLNDWASRKGIHPDAIGEAILQWLSDRCPSCGGLGLIGPKQCHPCGGTGNRVVHREDVTRVMKHITYCIDAATGGIARKR